MHDQIRLIFDNSDLKGRYNFRNGTHCDWPVDGVRQYQDFSLPGIFAPPSESSQWEPSLPGTKVPGNFCSGERMFPGTFIPGIVSSLLTRVRDAGTAVKVNRKNIVK